MGRKRLTVIPVPPYEFPEHILTQLPEPRRELLRRAGVWESITLRLPTPDVELIRDFITISDYGKLTQVVMEGRPVSLTSEMIAGALHLPVGGISSTLSGRLSTEVKTSVFGLEADTAKSGGGWDLRRIRQEDLAVWMTYLNQRIFCASQTHIASDEVIHVGWAAWGGERYDWSGLIYDFLLRELAAKKKRNTITLVSAPILSMICARAPTYIAVEPLAVRQPVLMTSPSDSSSIPASVPSQEASTVPTPIARASGGSVPRSHVDPAHAELLRQISEYREMQRSMRLELDAYRTKEIAWEARVRDSETARLEAVRLSREMSDSLVDKTKEFQILHQRHTDLQGESKKTKGVLASMSIQREEMEAEIETLRSQLTQTQAQLSALMTSRSEEIPVSSEAIQR